MGLGMMSARWCTRKLLMEMQSKQQHTGQNSFVKMLETSLESVAIKQMPNQGGKN